MEPWLIILVIVLAMLAALLFVVKTVAFPKEIMKNVGGTTKYYEKLKSGEIIPMRFEDFIKDYKKSSSRYQPKPNYLVVLNREVKKTGRGMTLTPRYVHFTIFDKLRYLKWYKEIYTVK